ncbi:unnamed protein product [Nippostrongylus brasiliensis]|uniref:Secreted protein n=1 Tax=Nippostrongylus brasiliensis TaxID=27835 RepID=A0A0N4YUU0_NIPBR|nr:unnamed protein product [Nippostrongylus brasiliensis]
MPVFNLLSFALIGSQLIEAIPGHCKKKTSRRRANPVNQGINVLPDAIWSRRVIDSRGTKVDSTDTYEMAVAVTYALKSILQCIGRHIRQSKELVLVFTGIFSRVTTVC